LGMSRADTPLDECIRAWLESRLRALKGNYSELARQAGYEAGTTQLRTYLDRKPGVAFRVDNLGRIAQAMDLDPKAFLSALRDFVVKHEEEIALAAREPTSDEVESTQLSAMPGRQQRLSAKTKRVEPAVAPHVVPRATKSR